jgi:hypothetical protein
VSELSDVAMIYATSVNARDERIDELEQALKDIKKHQELSIKGQFGLSATWTIADRALNK